MSDAAATGDMDAFDADVLIYAAVPDHVLGRRVLPLLRSDAPRVGSTVLLPELLSKPLREGAHDQAGVLAEVLGRLTLLPCTEVVGELASVLGAKYKLKAADAIHLATAVNAGAERFITNNARDFGTSIAEIDIVRPAALPDADAPPGPGGI
ncbi:type II toxin-antitoxin system VapC family toxin [Propioniciclava soli]|uniref:Type II toxin-antitoxin system VapC family toxin n=1 Tax=Propioniciclava soli TaxID=2775081 RepID=A0ABZ3C9I1_9ACTN|nr:type II toxin-antitoxin system VapC family toxin [Propioniciclava soli]